MVLDRNHGKHTGEWQALNLKVWQTLRPTTSKAEQSRNPAGIVIFKMLQLTANSKSKFQIQTESL